MAIKLDGYSLVGIINPNIHCTQISFIANNPSKIADSSLDPTKITEKELILFDEQIKYIQVETHPDIRRVKVYIRGEDESINIDFPIKELELYDLFIRSLYNK